MRSGLIDKVRGALGKVPFIAEALAAYYCAIDPATPTRVKMILMASLAYFIVPVDAVPDFIAMLGFTDDAAVFWAAWRSVSPHISDAHRARAQTRLSALRAEHGITGEQEQ